MKQKLDAKILDLLREEHTLSASDAAVRTGFSGASIRRCFQRLATLGEVRRVHGRIELPNRRNDPAYPFSLRMQWFAREKNALAAKASKLLRDCRTIFVDGGTTTAHLGEFLSSPDLRIVTNSLLLNEVITDHFLSGGGPEVILSGGRVERKSAILLGPEAEKVFTHFHAEAAVLSGTAIDEEYLYDNREESAHLQRLMIANADQVIVVADASKFGKKSLSCVIPAHKLSLIVTNFVSENYHVVQKLKEKGVRFEFINTFV